MAGEHLNIIKSLITPHPDFPKEGILFQDIFPIFKDPKATSSLFTELHHHIVSTFPKVDVIVGLDARGFLFGPTLALKLGCSFVPVRKKGKLPGKCESVTYQLEYGSDTLEMQIDGIKKDDNVVVVDDLIATGGTMKAAVDLIEMCGGNVLECLAVVELDGLDGRKKIGKPCHAIFQY